MPILDSPPAKGNLGPSLVRTQDAPDPSNPSPEPIRPPDESDVAGWLAVLIDPGQFHELRAPKAGKPGSKRATTVVKYFGPGQLPEMAREAFRLSGHAPAVYFTLNPVRAELADGRKSATDADVIGRRRLLIDCDPRRDPEALDAARREAKEQGRDFAGLSATDLEKATSLATAVAIRDDLTDRGWPEPVFADSGNGYHLIYAVDLPNDAVSRDLVKLMLESLATKFSSPSVEVDTSVFNASRIVKLYGTAACKGEHTAERPHRVSRVLKVPRAFTPVPRELIEALASEAATTAATRPKYGPTTPARKRDVGRSATPEGTTILPSDVPLPERLSRARKYLKNSDPAIEGAKGSNQTLKVACIIGVGFDLPPDDAYSIIRDIYNPNCVPPWPEDQLRRKVDEAYRKETRPPGFMLDSPRTRVNGQAHAGSDGQAHAGSNGRDGTPPGDEQGGRGQGEDPRIITITTLEYMVIDKAIEALSDDDDVYQRSNMLTVINRDAEPRNRIILRPPGSPRIAPLPLPRLRDVLTRCARWEKVRKTRDGADELVPAHPPDWAVAGVAARGSWPEIRSIEAVTETPVLRLDGTILDRPGYDDRTGLLFEPNAPFPKIPAAPTRADAGRAVDLLMGLVGDFPLANENHRAAWLAALLTPLARFAIAGPCPLFLIDANTPGTGKSKLTDIIAILATGRHMPRTTYPDSDDEMRKRISSIALAGDRLMLLDNIATTFGGSSLDSALTAMTWRDRILGRSEMTAELPLFTVWYATGNNVGLRGDVLRRIVPCRLETREERPEERRDFTIKGSLLEHVERERPRLVVAALTLLRAHAVAGWPDGGLNPLGSFEAWSRVVRSAVFWACGLDPCSTREELRATDPEALARTALVEGWLDLPEGRTGLTAAAALKLVKENALLYDTVRGVFMEWSKNDDLPNARSVGNRLKALKGRVINGKRLLSSEDRGILLWRVECDQPQE
jgi:hypothetical protein